MRDSVRAGAETAGEDRIDMAVASTKRETMDTSLSVIRRTGIFAPEACAPRRKKKGSNRKGWLQKRSLSKISESTRED